MYFLPSIRGIGLGDEMIEKCLDFALQNKFKHCYIETLPYMKAVKNFISKKDFTILTVYWKFGHLMQCLVN